MRTALLVLVLIGLLSSAPGAMASQPPPCINLLVIEHCQQIPGPCLNHQTGICDSHCRLGGDECLDKIPDVPEVPDLPEVPDVPKVPEVKPCVNNRVGSCQGEFRCGRTDERCTVPTPEVPEVPDLPEVPDVPD